MAKNDNLADFLKDIADTIRKKRGITGAIKAQDFAKEIAAISGGYTSKAVNDVTYYDYDGTVLHSYSADAFAALAEHPALPERNGLVCQGWNCDFVKAQEYVAKYGKVDIGASYITDDGKTRLYIRIAAEGRMTVPLYFSQTVANGVTIDWGDGSAAETLSGTGNVNTTHKYASIGDYCIALSVASGCTLGLGRNSASYCVMGSTGSNGRVYCNMLQRVEIGSSVTSIGSYAFSYCYSLASIVIPEGVTSISGYAFYYCYSLASIVIPEGVTSISSYAFYNCYGMAFYDFSALADVPSLSSTNAFQSIPSDCKIIVPDALYDTWKSVTNWSTYASYIIKKTEWDALNA